MHKCDKNEPYFLFCVVSVYHATKCEKFYINKKFWEFILSMLK